MKYHPKNGKPKLHQLMNETYINWDKVPYVEIKEENNKYFFIIPRKYKASIKEEWLEFNSEIDLRKYFNEKGFQQFDSETFINMHRIMLIKTEEVKKKTKPIQIEFIFEDGLTLLTYEDPKKWQWWKSSFLITA